MTATAGNAPAAAAPADAPTFSRPYTRYVLWLLLGINVVNFLDRQVVNILAEPIKRDLKISDTQLGLMTGLAFAIFYTILGLPIARLADRKNRATIIGCSAAIWSAFTALCGQAQNFVQLVLFRIGVGVGEAGCLPPSQSLIVDYVAKEKRGSALAFFSMGSSIGTLLGMVLGGLVADAYGWRTAFLIAGAPGLVFAVLALTTLREPRRVLAAHGRQVAANQTTFKATFVYLTAKRTFWLLAAGAAIKSLISYGQTPFIISFFLRNHAEELTQLAAVVGLKPMGFLGLVLGVVGGVFGTLGSFLGGWLADRAARKDVSKVLAIPALATLGGVPFVTISVLLDPVLAALALYSVSVVLITMWHGPTWGTMHSMVPSEMRATATAIMLLIINFVGLGLGPLAVGALSDLMNYGLGLGSAEGVRWALIASSGLGVLSFACFWAGRRTAVRDTID